MARVKPLGIDNFQADVSDIYLREAFTGTGNGTKTAWTSKATAFVGGTFVGTVLVERQNVNGSWIQVASFTAPGQVFLDGFDDRGPILTRFRCSAYTSGTIECELRA